MSQLTHWPAFPCSCYPLGDSLTRWVLGASRQDGQRSGGAGIPMDPRPASIPMDPDGSAARGGRRRKAKSVPAFRWGRVGPEAEGAQTGRYHEQFFIFSKNPIIPLPNGFRYPPCTFFNPVVDSQHYGIIKSRSCRRKCHNDQR